jgi:NAD(P)-dependent dehydrogenase (short-subunit alcohol dehydrogenase family)
MRFEAKKVVITGGCGGIGMALVKLFANEGARVLFSDRSEEDCCDLSETLQQKNMETIYLAGDLRQKSYCERLIAHAVNELGGIDILINNAGIIPRGNILETTDDMWFSALDVNLNAAFFLCRKEPAVVRSSILHPPGAFIPDRVMSPTAPARPHWRRSPETWVGIMPATVSASTRYAPTR